MTPAQRKYDIDLAASMITLAKRIEPRSKKVADMLMLGSQRITALVSIASGFDTATPIDPSRNSKQPASTPISNR